MPLSSCDCFQPSPQHTVAPAYHHGVLQKGLTLSGASKRKAQFDPLQEASPPLLLTGLLMDTSFRLTLQQSLVYILTTIKSG